MTIRQKLSGWHATIRGTFLLIWAFALLFGNPAQTALAQALTTAGCKSGPNCIYVPFISVSGTTATDLAINGMEVTQVIQDDAGSVPLVAGKATMLRIFATVSGTAQPLSGIKVTVSAARDGKLLSGAPKVLQTAVPTSTSRSVYTSTTNLQLPAAWLSGTVNLTVTLDPDSMIREVSETNNTVTRQVTFTPVPPLTVMIVPVQYTHVAAGGSRIFPAPSTDTISDWIMRMYPISQLNIRWHAPFAFSGNLLNSNDWSNLLNQVTSLKQSEGGASSTVYYALIPVSDGSVTWFSSGIAGMGWIGSRVAIGLNVSGKTGSQIAAHELGHNLGMPHTPCGSVAGADINYPYPDGSIGQYGLDVSTATLYSPSGMKDIMSYCEPKWISDYTYKKLFNDQVTKGAASLITTLSMNTAQHQILTQVSIQTGGQADTAEFQPSYILPGAPGESPQPGEYEIQALSPQGEVLAQVSVQAVTAETDVSQVTSIHAAVPVPDRQVARLRLLKGDQILAEQAIDTANDAGNAQASNAPASFSPTVSRVENGYALEWSGGGRPALVRYSSDGRQTWSTIQVGATGGSLFVTDGQLPQPGGVFEVIPANTWR